MEYELVLGWQKINCSNKIVKLVRNNIFHWITKTVYKDLKKEWKKLTKEQQQDTHQELVYFVGSKEECKQKEQKVKDKNLIIEMINKVRGTPHLRILPQKVRKNLFKSLEDRQNLSNYDKLVAVLLTVKVFFYIESRKVNQE